jgi:D-inositol-3-phosphate glycosyltransferase
VRIYEVVYLRKEELHIAMLSVHSSPIGPLGTRDTGGMSVCMREVARELGRRGHKVDIYTRRSDPSSRETMGLYENVRLVQLRSGNATPMDKPAVYDHLGDFYKELETFTRRRKLRYDLIHSHYWLSGRVGQWAREQWRVPHIVTFHTLGAVKNNIQGVEPEPEVRVNTERRLTQTCERILTNTEQEKQQVIRYYGASPEAIGVVPCGVNLGLFSPMHATRARRQLGFDPNGTLLLYVGRFAPSKGVDRLLAAMPLLKNPRGVQLMVIGGDGNGAQAFQDLKGMCIDLGIQDTVFFLGNIQHERLPAYYSAADLLVVPSRYESFGIVALEALACGTPVVATRVGAMEAIIREGETGHVVTNGPPDWLARGIEKIIPLSAGVSPRALNASVARYDWSIVATEILNEYLGVLGKR